MQKISRSLIANLRRPYSRMSSAAVPVSTASAQDPYWNNHWQWYDSTYRPYYHRYYGQGYYNNPQPYYGNAYGNPNVGTTYYGSPYYGPYYGGGVQIGPLRLGWW